MLETFSACTISVYQAPIFTLSHLTPPPQKKKQPGKVSKGAARIMFACQALAKYSNWYNILSCVSVLIPNSLKFHFHYAVLRHINRLIKHMFMLFIFISCGIDDVPDRPGLGVRLKLSCSQLNIKDNLVLIVYNL